MPQQNHLDQRAKVPRLQVAKETIAIAANTETGVFYKLPVKGQERERERERELGNYAPVPVSVWFGYNLSKKLRTQKN